MSRDSIFASRVRLLPSGGVTATNLQGAVDQLAAAVGDAGDAIDLLNSGKADTVHSHAYAPTGVKTIAAGAGAESVDATGLGTIDLTLVDDVTLTVSNLAAGQYVGLHVRQGGTGGHSLTVTGVSWSPGDPDWYPLAGARTAAALYSPDGVSIEGVHNAPVVEPDPEIDVVQMHAMALSSVGGHTFTFTNNVKGGNRLVGFFVTAGGGLPDVVTRDASWTELAAVNSSGSGNPVVYVATKVVESDGPGTYEITLDTNGLIQGVMFELAGADTPDSDVPTSNTGFSSATSASIGPVSNPTTDRPGIAFAVCGWSAGHGSVTSLTNGYELQSEHGRLAVAMLAHNGTAPLETTFEWTTAAAPRLAIINVPAAG